MCLSTAYKIEKKPENELMRNVMLVSTDHGVVTLTDIMGRELSFAGEVACADLTAGTLVLRPDEKGQ